ncbi:MAG: VWA domain-containing protein [Bryobacteraceae bacterium]
MRTILLLLAPVLAAQTVPEPTLRITVNLVQVDAVVTDSHGKRVTGLTKDDFVILQDGKPHKVTHCTYFAEPPAARVPAVAGVAAPPLQPSQTRRVVALVVDDLGMSFSSMHYARETLRKYVDEQMQPGDLAAIVRTGASSSAYQRFTNDKQLLHAAIEKLRWNGLGRASPDVLETTDTTLPDIDGAGPGEIKFLQEEMSSLGTVGALSWVVKGLRGLPGRKSVIFLSDGFRMWSMRPKGDVPFVALFERLLVQLRKLTDQANRAGVVIYTIDPRGLQVGRPQAGIRMVASSSSLSGLTDTWDGMRHLAQETGGLFVKNDNDLVGAVRKAVDDQNGYYVLGYNPGADAFKLERGESKYHRVAVKVKRAGLQVRARGGFLGTADEALPPEPRGGEQPLLASLFSPFSSGDVRLHLAALFGNASDVGSYVHAMVHIDGRDLKFAGDGAGFSKASVDVVLAVFDAGGEVKGSINKNFAIRLPNAALDVAKKGGFLYQAMLPVKKPGAYQFRIGVRDPSTGKMGSASQFVRVADIENGRLALSGISLDNRLEAGGNEAPEREVMGGPALRVFRPGEPIYCGAVVYNAAGTKGKSLPSVEMQVRLLRDGKVIWRGDPYPLKTEGQSDPRRILFVQKLTLGPRTPAGAYVLQVVATGRSAAVRATVAQWTDFELVKAN